MNKRSKKELRSHFLIQRDNLKIEDKKKFDSSINQQLIDLVNTLDLYTIHAYLPMKSEINIYPFIQFALDMKLTVVCPKSLSKGIIENYVLNSLKEVEKGIFGTTHPANSTIHDGHYDLIIIPGLAFTPQFDRLGYGGGYYDRFLQNHQNALKVAVAYDFQIADDLPIESHDIRVDKIIVP